MSEKIPFNTWSKRRIAEGRKVCTARKKLYNDPRVCYVTNPMQWGYIRDHWYLLEGAHSPDELQEVIVKIFRRHVDDEEMFFVHFGDFREDST